MNEGFVTRIKNCHSYITIASQEREGRCQYGIEKYIMNKTLDFRLIFEAYGHLIDEVIGSATEATFQAMKRPTSKP